MSANVRGRVLSPESPCVRNCCLDADDVCLGCGRHLQEIIAWQQADPGARAAILERATARRNGRNIGPPRGPR